MFGLGGDIYKDIRHKLPPGYTVGGPVSPSWAYLNRPVGEAAGMAYEAFAGRSSTKWARQSTFLFSRNKSGIVGWGAGIGAAAGFGAGYAMGGLGGGILGALPGAFIGGAPTGFQAVGMAGAGAAIGGMIGGEGGAITGAIAGGAIGAMGPGHLTKRIWKSGMAGKVGLSAGGVAGVGTLGLAAIGPGAGADSTLAAGGALMTAGTYALPVMGAAAMALPGRKRFMSATAAGAGIGGMVAGPMGAVAGGVAGAGLGLGLGITDVARGGNMALRAAGKKGFGATGSILGSTMRYMARRPGRAGGLLGVALGASALASGLVGLASGTESYGSMAVGSREATYGMDPNNLNTQALTLALHYRHS